MGCAGTGCVGMGCVGMGCVGTGAFARPAKPALSGVEGAKPSGPMAQALAGA